MPGANENTPKEGSLPQEAHSNVTTFWRIRGNETDSVNPSSVFKSINGFHEGSWSSDFYDMVNATATGLILSTET